MGSIFLLSSCTKQSKVFYYGGKETIKITPNEKLINVTWKEDNIWVLTRRMTPTDSCETYYFTESSSMGLFEGQLILIETKSK